MVQAGDEHSPALHHRLTSCQPEKCFCAHLHVLVGELPQVWIHGILGLDRDHEVVGTHVKWLQGMPLQFTGGVGHETLHLGVSAEVQ